LEASHGEPRVDSVDRLTVKGGYRRNLPQGSLEVSSLVYVRYMDHVLFRNAEPEKQAPIIQEAWGILDCDTEDYIRLVMARYPEPSSDGDRIVKATGLVILKKTILEMRSIG
jgi:hypothetical protein